jgi:serine/threonine protein kinase
MLIQEFCPDSLDAFVERQPSGPGLSKDAPTFYRISAAICEVLCFLHDRNIAHRDLKVASSFTSASSPSSSLLAWLAHESSGEDCPARAHKVPQGWRAAGSV